MVARAKVGCFDAVSGLSWHITVRSSGAAWFICSFRPRVLPVKKKKKKTVRAAVTLQVKSLKSTGLQEEQYDEHEQGKCEGEIVFTSRKGSGNY
jgi:hypothetical protein